MTILTIVLIIAILFYLLAKSADLIVVQVKSFSKRFGVPLSFLGIILGLLTSLPELSIGMNTIAERSVSLSLGNLLGGIIVLFGLIYGGGIILNRKIKTDGKIYHILPFFIYIFLALIFGIDGKINEIEGLFLIFGYFTIILYLYKKGRKTQHDDFHNRRKLIVFKKIFIIILGFVSVIIISKFIVLLSLSLISLLHIQKFFVGAVIFSIGTNIPEIIITIRSWQKHIRELSISNLYGSAIANVFVIGILSFIRPITITINAQYYAMALSLFVLFITILFFYKSGKKLSRQEGFVLVFIYIISILMQIILI